MEVSKNEGHLFGSPYNKDRSIFGLALGRLIFGNSACCSDCISEVCRCGRLGVVGGCVWALRGL